MSVEIKRRAVRISDKWLKNFQMERRVTGCETRANGEAGVSSSVRNGESSVGGGKRE